jgi:SAM-dependent methyltransferase
MTSESERPEASDRFFAREDWLRAKEVFFFRNRPSLLDRLLEQRSYFPQVLDCGTGIGSLIRHIVARQEQVRTFYRENTAGDPQLVLFKPIEPLIQCDWVTGIDLDNSLLAIARQDFSQVKGVEFRAAAVENLPFEDGTFDLVMTQEMLDHVSDPVSALQEMWRVLKPGGVLLCLRNADSEIILWPESGALTGIDTKIISNFNKYFLIKGGTDNQCGRKLYGYAKDVGLSDVVIENTPWFIYPSPKLEPGEQGVLQIIVEFFYSASNEEGVRYYCKGLSMDKEDFIKQNALDEWRLERLHQIDTGELVLYVNYFSLMATK